MLHHTDDNEESDLPLSPTLDTSHAGDQLNQSGDCESMGLVDDGVDEYENASVTPTVFSSDNEDNATLESLPPVSHNTPNASSCLTPTTNETLVPTDDTDTVPTSMPTTDQHESDVDPTTATPSNSSTNIIFYGTSIAVAGALIYNKLNC